MQTLPRKITEQCRVFPATDYNFVNIKKSKLKSRNKKNKNKGKNIYIYREKCFSFTKSGDWA